MISSMRSWSTRESPRSGAGTGSEWFRQPCWAPEPGGRPSSRPWPIRGSDVEPDEPLRVRIHYDPDLLPEDVTTVGSIPVTTVPRTPLDDR